MCQLLLLFLWRTDLFHYISCKSSFNHKWVALSVWYCSKSSSFKGEEETWYPPHAYFCYRNCFGRPGITYALYVPWFMGNRKRWCLSDIHVPAILCTGTLLCATSQLLTSCLGSCSCVHNITLPQRGTCSCVKQQTHIWTNNLIHTHIKEVKELWGGGWKEVSAVIHICRYLLIISGLNLIWFVNDHVLMGTLYSKNLSGRLNKMNGDLCLQSASWRTWLTEIPSSFASLSIFPFSNVSVCFIDIMVQSLKAYCQSTVGVW